MFCICHDMMSILDANLMVRHPRRNGLLDPLTPLLLAFRAEVLENVIHLFERFARRLRHKPVHPDQAQQREHREEDVSAVACTFDQGRRNQANDEVEQPVGARRESVVLSVRVLAEFVVEMTYATPFARREDGKTSAGIAHGTGPHDAPKPSMKTRSMATLAQPSGRKDGQS